MASPQVNMRWPEALVARVDAQGARRGMTRTEYAIEALLSLLELDEEEAAHGKPGAEKPDLTRAERPPEPSPSIARRVRPEPRPLPAVVRASALKPAPQRGAEASGVRVVAKLDTSMVPVHDGRKRPAYQKGQAAKGKGGR